MILTLDVGNSQIFGGVFRQGALVVRFRKPSRPPTSSDELGLFLRGVLRENETDPSEVEQIAFCSVVPDVIYSLRSCCRKYFSIDPFILQPGAKTGLKIRYRNPLELGSDRIANAIGATHLYPDRHLIIVGLGTVTTVRCGPRRPRLPGRHHRPRLADRRWKPSKRIRPVFPMLKSSGPLSSLAGRRSSASSPASTSATGRCFAS